MKGQPAANPSAAPAAATRGAPGADRIDLMQTFVRIVEAGSLSLAAAQLQTTQPTISRRLQTLERQLGVRLLQRSTHAMKLTEDGARCYERARELVADWARFEADVRGVGHAPSGTLRVVVPHAFGQEVLVGPLADYLRQYPQVAVEWLLHDRTPDFIAEAIDCAIHVGEVHEPGLVAVRLAEVPRAVIAAPSLFDGKPLPRRPQDLEGLPWLALRTFYRNEIVLQHLQTEARHGLAFAPRMSTDSLYALHAAARLGLGVAVGSSWIFADDIASGRLLHLLPQWQADPLPIYLVYPHARFYPAKLRLFADAMRQAIPTAGMVERPRVPRGRGAGRMPQARR
ncbi:Regulatory protein, LysR:LysR, substrate-binding [Cupriavidus taiwanensis]|uniref:LysR family transcriptional regulator n=1 Tax=Cupriavidus taiwanensis TaxID=164546 RepID=UPI000E10BCFB|nr:LysR family transcriptional regulator [Cupriavidus taiwanensis]ULX52324.1 LysR family transcriptional regulator [Cupriavidus taiwanensis]SPA43574.1 Regulatory protein, LysR:LysR, substrate-binding [Cupriavidus taiwanensis]